MLITMAALKCEAVGEALCPHALIPLLVSSEARIMTTQTETKYFNGKLFDRMQDMNRTWLERLREIRQIEAEYGSKLLAAKTPSDAASICNEWMAKRLETVANEQKAFTTAWLDLFSDMAISATPTQAVKAAAE
jgi:hypothetical protein